MSILEQLEELKASYAKLAEKNAALNEAVKLILMDESKLPEFGDAEVIARILSGREEGKLRASSITKLSEQGILTRKKVLDKWMYHVPTALREFRAHMEDKAEVFEIS